jgi:hypothetical protein
VTLGSLGGAIDEDIARILFASRGLLVLAIATPAVVGGAVTDSRLGQGPIGRRDGGTFQLAVSPTLLRRWRSTTFLP